MTQTMRPKPKVTLSNSVTKLDDDDVILQQFGVIKQNSSYGHVVLHLA
jgi:hypothetical protein